MLDWLLDRLRTTVNVLGDVYTAVIVDYLLPQVRRPTICPRPGPCAYSLPPGAELARSTCQECG